MNSFLFHPVVNALRDFLLLIACGPGCRSARAVGDCWLCQRTFGCRQHPQLSLIWNFLCVQYSSVVLCTFYGVYCKSVTVLCISDGCKGSVRTAAFNVAACQLMNSSAPPNLLDSCLPFGVQRHYFDMKGTGTGSIRIISASRNS